MYVWRRLSLLALRSHSQEVTGMVHAILRSTHSLMAAATVDGLLSGGRFSYRNFHRIISCGTSSGDGKSSCMIHLYCIVELTFLTQIMAGTRVSRDVAVVESGENRLSRLKRI